MSIRTAVVTDYMSPHQNEIEFMHIEDSLRRRLGDSVKVVYTGDDFDYISTFDGDLLVVDFGGLVQSYTSPVGDYMRLVRKWADEHPSGFVLLWSSMTADIFVSQWRYEDPDGGYQDGWYKPVEWPANVRALDKGVAIAAYSDKTKDANGYLRNDEWREWEAESWRRAREWLGVAA